MISLTRPTTPPHLCEIQFYFLLSPRPPRVAEFPERALFPAFDFIAATTTAQYSSPLGSAPPLNNTSKLSLREREEGREKERGWNLAWRESVEPPVVHFRAWLFEGKYFYVRRGGILDAFLIPFSWIRKRVYVIRNDEIFGRLFVRWWKKEVWERGKLERKMFFFLSFNEEVSLLVSGVWILF